MTDGPLRIGNILGDPGNRGFIPVSNGEFQARGKMREAYRRLRPLGKLKMENEARHSMC